jgi:hypothetical protein
MGKVPFEINSFLLATSSWMFSFLSLELEALQAQSLLREFSQLQG